MISADRDVLGTLEYMQTHVPTEKLVGVARQLGLLAPAIWGHHPQGEVVPFNFNPGRAECAPKAATE